MNSHSQPSQPLNAVSKELKKAECALSTLLTTHSPSSKADALQLLVGSGFPCNLPPAWTAKLISEYINTGRVEVMLGESDIALVFSDIFPYTFVGSRNRLHSFAKYFNNFDGYELKHVFACNGTIGREFDGKNTEEILEDLYYVMDESQDGVVVILSRKADEPNTQDGKPVIIAEIVIELLGSLEHSEMFVKAQCRMQSRKKHWWRNLKKVFHKFDTKSLQSFFRQVFEHVDEDRNITSRDLVVLICAFLDVKFGPLCTFNEHFCTQYTDEIESLKRTLQSWDATRAFFDANRVTRWQVGGTFLSGQSIGMVEDIHKDALGLTEGEFGAGAGSDEMLVDSVGSDPIEGVPGEAHVGNGNPIPQTPHRNAVSRPHSSPNSAHYHRNWQWQDDSQNESRSASRSFPNNRTYQRHSGHTSPRSNMSTNVHNTGAHTTIENRNRPSLVSSNRNSNDFRGAHFSEKMDLDM